MVSRKTKGDPNAVFEIPAKEAKKLKITDPSAGSIIQKAEREHEKEARIQEKRPFTLMIAECNPFDGVLSGAICTNHHVLNNQAHYFECPQDHHPTDRWMTFQDTGQGWTIILQRLTNAIGWKAHQIKALQHSLGITKQIVEQKMLETESRTAGGLIIPNE